MFNKSFMLISVMLIFVIKEYYVCCETENDKIATMKDINNNFDENSSSINVKTTATEEEEEINLVDIMNYCNESFRINMDFLQELNDTGSFPDEADKTPMVSLYILLSRLLFCLCLMVCC